MLSIVLAEDHKLIARAICLMLEQTGVYQIVGEAHDGLEAINLVEQHRPDVLLLDLGLPRLHGLEVLTRIRESHPKTRIIILSMYDFDRYLMDAMRLGADGYVVKDESREDLFDAIQTVMQGKRYVSPSLVEQLVHLETYSEKHRVSSRYELLTKREREVLHQIAEGLTSAEIAELLHISPRTVDRHRSNLMEKLKIHNVADLVRFMLAYYRSEVPDVNTGKS